MWKSNTLKSGFVLNFIYENHLTKSVARLQVVENLPYSVVTRNTFQTKSNSNFLNVLASISFEFLSLTNNRLVRCIRSQEPLNQLRTPYGRHLFQSICMLYILIPGPGMNISRVIKYANLYIFVHFINSLSSTSAEHEQWIHLMQAQ